MSLRNLDSLFQPATVAVIGASDRPGSVGQCLEHNEGMAALARRCGLEVATVPSGDTLSLRLKL